MQGPGLPDISLLRIYPNNKISGCVHGYICTRRLTKMMFAEVSNVESSVHFQPCSCIFTLRGKMSGKMSRNLHSRLLWSVLGELSFRNFLGGCIQIVLVNFFFFTKVGRTSRLRPVKSWPCLCTCQVLPVESALGLRWKWRQWVHLWVVFRKREVCVGLLQEDQDSTWDPPFRYSSWLLWVPHNL